MKRAHGAVNLQIGCRDRRARFRIGDHDSGKTPPEIGKIAAHRQNRHNFGSDRDVEAAFARIAVELAAAAIGTEGARIAKSLTFYGKEGECILIVTAGDQKIDNAKFKRRFGIKAACALRSAY